MLGVMRALGVGVLGACCAACFSWSSTPTGPSSEQDASTGNEIPEAGGTLLATIQSPFDLAIDTQAAFLISSPLGSSSGSILRIPLDGGPAVTIAASPSPSGLAIDDAAVYWTDYQGIDAGSILSVGKEGGSVVVLATSNGPENVAVDDAYVYWADWYGAVWRVPKSGGTPFQLGSASQDFPYSLAVDDTYAYVGVTTRVGFDGGLLRFPKDGGAPQQLIGNLIEPEAIVVDDAGVYAAGATTDDAGNLAAVIDRYDKSSGRTAVVALAREGVGPIFGMALVGQRLYFSAWSAPGSIEVVSAAGGAPVILATNLEAPLAVAVEGSDLYWIDLGQPGEAGDLRVLRGAAKP